LSKKGKGAAEAIGIDLGTSIIKLVGPDVR